MDERHLAPPPSHPSVGRGQRWLGLRVGANFNHKSQDERRGRFRPLSLRSAIYLTFGCTWTLRCATVRRLLPISHHTDRLLLINCDRIALVGSQRSSGGVTGRGQTAGGEGSVGRASKGHLPLCAVAPPVSRLKPPHSVDSRRAGRQ
jgi:hypothetical protein